MAQDDDVRASQQEGDRGGGLHEHAAHGAVAQLGSVLVGKLGFLGLPDLVAHIINDGQHQLVVLLDQGGHADALHDRVGVLHAVAQTAGGGVDDDALQGHAQVAKQDVELLGQVHVDGAAGDDGLVVGQGGGAHGLVVVLVHRAQEQVLALEVLGDALQGLGILVGVGAAPDDDRHLHRGQHLAHGLGGLLGGRVVGVGVGGLQLDHDGLGPELLHALLGPGAGVAGHVGHGVQTGGGPVFGHHVPHLHGQHGAAGHLPLEGVEWVAVLAAHLERLVALAQGDLKDFAGVGYFRYCKGHSSSLPFQEV